MKTRMKTLIAAAVIAVHALSVMAAMNPGDGRVQAAGPVVQTPETEWQLPAVVVSARSMDEHGSRSAARCDEREHPSPIRRTHHG